MIVCGGQFYGREVTVKQVLAWVLVLATGALAAPKAEEVPTFAVRARVLEGKGKVTVRVGERAAAVMGDQWSEWLAFDRAAIEKNLKGYPAMYMKGWPIVTHVSFDGLAGLSKVEGELKFDEGGAVIALRGELFGHNLGLLVWREEGKPLAATMAEYNRRYWKQLEGLELKVRPSKFGITDRFIGGDDDRVNWREGISALHNAGFSAIMLPPTKAVREIAREVGVTRTAWAVYSPPGYAFDTPYPGQKPPEPLEQWAAKEAKAYVTAGWDVKDLAIFAMSDEPGWYYPSTLKLGDDPAVRARFHAYLQQQGLKPADVGAERWDDVKPIGRSAATDLPKRRLFYWSMRFFPWDSSRYFAESTAALEKAFYPGMPLTTNWNFFAGRSYVPGPVANNGDKTSPDAAMGGHDWFEFARMRGGTMLWTEDWFPDAQAYQWSFYCAKMRSAAAKGKIEFGGYVIPRTSGDRADGLLQKVMCLVGSGGKAVKYFVFGPEYNFPGNCHSERPGMLRKMAEVNVMIGAAEELLWPGRRPKPQVAIVMPRSAQMWDLKEMTVAKGIDDATNTNLNGKTVDYMAEVFNLFLALQHANVPVDFVEEEDLSVAGLAGYRVVYLTAPNVPEEHQRGLLEWMQAGGTLATVSGTATHDRYDEPCDVLAEQISVLEQQPPRARFVFPNLAFLTEDHIYAQRIQGRPFTVHGIQWCEVKGPNEFRGFGQLGPGVYVIPVERGRRVHFNWLPGLSYAKSATGKKDGLPVGYADEIRQYIETPLVKAGIVRPVETDRAMVETPLLLSDAGAAITVLNWTGEPIESLRVKVRLPFKARSVEGVRAGKLAFEQDEKGLTVTMPVGAVDVLMIRP
jgi:hypothetical protein